MNEILRLPFRYMYLSSISMSTSKVDIVAVVAQEAPRGH